MTFQKSSGLGSPVWGPVLRYAFRQNTAEDRYPALPIRRNVP